MYDLAKYKINNKTSLVDFGFLQWNSVDSSVA